MAILQQGSLGVFTGKVGALVISKWKDKYVGKSTPKPSAKKATDLQLSQQAKFRIAGEFMRMFRSEVHFSFQKPPKNMTAMNYAMWYNLHHSIDGVYPDFTLNYSKVKLSKPADYSTEIDNGFNVAVKIEGRKIKVTWEEDDMVDNDATSPTDRAYCFIYHPEKSISTAVPLSPQRSDLALTVNLPSFFAGEVQVWLLFMSDDLKFVSETEHLGEFTITYIKNF
jgi:hypothetical protein